VILEAETPLPPLAGGDLAAGTATIIRQNPQRLEIETALPGDGYLVLLDTFYPGWIASVDDQPTPIYQADYLARAIFVPAGKHLVRFEYQPASFRWGLWLALVMIIILAVTAIASTHKKRPTTAVFSL
jgi:uncharacterized membrane protein YfhO